MSPDLSRADNEQAADDWQPTPVEALVETMVEDWRRGVRTSAEDVLARHPELDDEAVVRLVFEETCLRRESGLEVLTSEVVGRFPRLGSELEILLRCDRLMRPSAPVEFPEVGDTLGDFELLLELGRGASGRTFVAAQPALADRPVVLKVMPGHLDEHLSLASLQHTYIVPLYSAQLFPDRGLRGLCMPFLGGASLAKLLERLDAIEPARRTGRDLLDALDRQVETTFGEALEASGPFRRFLERASYVKAVCWVAACLADALQYAHDRGLVHMDVKPSNVLIAGDGQPMLLDFHLAREPIEPGSAPFDRLGGTPGWMAPEQSRALAALRDGRPIDDRVDGRADVYALGLLLEQALGRQPARLDDPRRPRLNRVNPQVSVALADLVERCLRRDATSRYRAGELADDLRRHLDDRPLRGVPNRSIAERWRKWRRRSPHALIRGSAGLSTLGAGMIACAILVESHRHRGVEVDEALADARRLRQAGQFAEALRAVDRGTELSRSLLASADRSRALVDERAIAVRGAKARVLHELADLLRFRSGSGPVPPPVESRCWKIVDEWSSQATGHVGRLDEATEQRISDDLAELDRALGRPGAEHAEARSLDDHRERGRSLLQSGQFEAASVEFQRAINLDPRDFWANFHQGVADYRLGRFDDALAAFRVCVALSPSTPECYFNRALALEALGKPELAIQDYSKAIERAPKLAAAYLNRGILSRQAGRSLEALDDFAKGLRILPERDLSASLRYNQGLALIALNRKDEARQSLAEADRLGHPEAAKILDRLGR